MAEVGRIFVAPARHVPMREVGEARAVLDQGLEGCVHGRPGGKRQVLLVEEEVLLNFGLQPGMVRENITTRGLSLAELPRGQELLVGEALLETTGPCEPCSRMDELRMGLQKEIHGRRGIMCRVIRGGMIRRGDPIEVHEGAVNP